MTGSAEGTPYIDLAAQPAAQPAAGADSSGILPDILGSSYQVYALSNGAYPQDLVIVGSNLRVPVKWQNGSWSSLPLPQGNYTQGYAESVSDGFSGGPAMTVHLLDGVVLAWDSWVLSPGQPAVELAMQAGATHINAAIISAQGNHIVGGTTGMSTNRAVRWTRDEGGWLPPEEIAPGSAVATTADGSVVIGNTRGMDDWRNGGPWVWTANSSGGEIELLEPKAGVYDITHDGAMIVGARPKACDPSWGCDYFAGPVYWVLEDGQWVMHDLEALDGVYSVATDVANVNGRPVIVGEGWTDQDGGILRAVVWLPDPTGGFGPPLRLEALGGNFESFAVAFDVNRHGMVIGWSETKPWGDAPAVIWNLFEQAPFAINAGHSGAWFNPQTAGQGQFIDVEPGNQFMFLSWFTYTGAGSASPNQQHWFTAQGNYAGDTADLIVHETLGGRFDDPQAVGIAPVGEAQVRFSDCGLGEMSYRLDHWGVEGTFPLQRVIPGSAGPCEVIGGNAAQAIDINAGMDGAWYDPATGGQGIFIDARPDAQGGNFIFVSWFTYGEGTASGQRWLTAQGGFDGSLAEIDVHETTGGRFDAPGSASTVKVGTMSIDFSDCANAVLSYSLTNTAVSGAIELTRVVPGSAAMCQALATAD